MKKGLYSLLIFVLVLCFSGCSIGKTISSLREKEVTKEQLQECLEIVELNIDNYQKYFQWQDVVFNPKDQFGDYTGETQGYRSLKLIDDSYYLGYGSENEVVFKIYSNCSYSYFDPNYPTDNYHDNSTYEDETTYTYYKNDYSDDDGQWYQGNGVDFQTLWQDRNGYRNITNYNVLTVNKVKGKLFKFNMNDELFNEAKDFGDKTAKELGRYVYKEISQGPTKYGYYIFENGYVGYLADNQESVSEAYQSFDQYMIDLAENDY